MFLLFDKEGCHEVALYFSPQISFYLKKYGAKNCCNHFRIFSSSDGYFLANISYMMLVTLMIFCFGWYTVYTFPVRYQPGYAVVQLAVARTRAV